MAADRDEDTVQQDFRKQAWFEAQVEKLLVARAVVVLLLFHTGIGEVLDGHRVAKLFSLAPDGFGQFQDAEGLGELVEDAVFSRLGGIEDGKFDAAQGVANIQEGPSLTAGAVKREWNARHGLDAKAVQGSAKDCIIVKTGCQARVQFSFVRGHPVDNALVEVRGAQLPRAAREHDVVTVMDFAQMIER